MQRECRPRGIERHGVASLESESTSSAFTGGGQYNLPTVRKQPLGT
jgi:hypothetical protein